MAWFSFRLAMLKIGSRFSATHLPQTERAFERSLYRDAPMLDQSFVIVSTCESTMAAQESTPWLPVQLHSFRSWITCDYPAS